MSAVDDYNFQASGNNSHNALNNTQCANLSLVSGEEKIPHLYFLCLVTLTGKLNQ